MRILAFDPSGNFKEGKGTSGLCTVENGEPLTLDEIRAATFDCAEAYWLAHLNFIRHYEPDEVCIEGYRLYNHKGMAASTQANSELETPQIIGAIKLHCYIEEIPLYVQYAKDVKSRWSDDVLVAKGYLERKGKLLYFNGKATSTHKRDALRHALHHSRYGGKR